MQAASFFEQRDLSLHPPLTSSHGFTLWNFSFKKIKIAGASAVPLTRPHGELTGASENKRIGRSRNSDRHTSSLPWSIQPLLLEDVYQLIYSDSCNSAPGGAKWQSGTVRRYHGPSSIDVQ